MPRAYLRRLSRQYRQNEKPWYLRPFGAMAAHPRYFAANRRSIAGGLSIGVLVSMLPLPGHTITAVLIALILGYNLGVAALGAWFNTPLTMLPVFYFEYRLGRLLLGMDVPSAPTNPGWNWLKDQLHVIWKPLFLGASVVALTSGVLAYALVTAAWRFSVLRRYRRRRLGTGAGSAK
jgi:uncharacterized protein (DUF2062 family)